MTFDELPTEVARQGVILEEIQSLLSNWLNQPKQEDETFFNVLEASKFLGITKGTLYVKVSKREIPSIRRGGKLYFSKYDLTEYLNSGRRKTNDDIKVDALNYLSKKGGRNAK